MPNGAEIDRLDIKISAAASSADDVLKDLQRSLQECAAALKTLQINTKGQTTASKEHKEETEGETKAVKDLAKATEKAAEAGGALKDSFQFKGTRKEIEAAASLVKKMGMGDAAGAILGIADDNGITNLEKAKEMLNGIADAWDENGKAEAAAGLRAAAKDLKGLNDEIGDARRELEEELKLQAEVKRMEEQLAKDAARWDREAKKEKERAAAQAAAEAKRKEAEAAKAQAKADREAAREAAKLAKEQERAAKAAEKQAEKEAKTAEKLELAKKKTTEIKGTFKDLSDNTKKATGALGKLFKSLGRIAFYRAIRTAIKNLSSAIKEGLTNLYAYSQEAGTVFAPMVNELRQHISLLKNAFATALRPVIEAVIPLIIRLVDALAKLADFLAQVFSVVTGNVDENGRYTKAILGDLQEANDEAKELRRTLLGFDEINRLDGDTGPSTASGASTQFVQADISESARKVGEFIKSIPWDTVLKVLEALAIAVGLLQVFKLAGNFFQALKSIGSLASSIGIVPILIAAAIAAMAIWGDEISEWCEKARTDVNGFFGKIPSTGSEALDSLVKFAGDTTDILLDSVGTLSRLVHALVKGDTKTALKELTHLVMLFIKGIIALLEALWGLVAGLLDDLYDWILKFAQLCWNYALQPFFNRIAIVIDNLDKALKAIWLDFKIAGMWALGLILEAIADAADITIGIFNGIIATLNAFGASIEPIDVNVHAEVEEFYAVMDEVKKERAEMEATPWDAELVLKWNDEDLKKNKLGLKDAIDFSGAYKALDELERAVKKGIDNAYKDAIAVAAQGAGNYFRDYSKVTATAYASGGFPTAGSLFVAGETHGAEWVGDINGRTAVVTSEQMAAAIYGAMSAALANNPQGGGDIYLDGEVIYRNTVRHNNNAVRATGRSALLV